MSNHPTAILCALLLICGCSSRDDREGSLGSEQSGELSERSSDPWGHARSRGVDFRAIGQEPGWYLEIVENERIVLVLGYGSDTLVAEAPSRFDTAPGVTGYAGDSGDRSFTIQVRHESCEDVMSGEKFEAAVEVAVDDQTYSGCGRALQ